MKGAFVYVDAGKGHYVPAVALSDAMKAMGDEAIVEDLFVIFKSPIVRWGSKNYWRYLLHHPKLEKKINRLNDNRNAHDLLLWLKNDPRGYNNFKKWYYKEKPDFIVSTNFMGATLLPALIEKMGVKCPVYDYVADLFDQVKCGIDGKITKVYVPTEIGVEHTIEMGQPESTVELSPFPLSRKFETMEKVDKSEARRRLNLKDKYFPIVELGIGSADCTDDITNIHYETSAPYARIGVDFNLLKNKHDDYRLFAGVRYAFTSFKYDLTHPGMEDPVWGNVAPYEHEDVKCSYQWFEAVFGVDAKIWGPLHLGWSVRYKSRLSADEGKLGNAWYVPGFGKSDSSTLGGTFNVSIDI